MTTTESEEGHQHKLVYLGQLKGEYGGSYALYQCRECGATFELFEGAHYAVFYPEWTRDRATQGKETARYASDKIKPKSWKRIPALGKKLVEIQSEQVPTGRGLAALFGEFNDSEEKG